MRSVQDIFKYNLHIFNVQIYKKALSGLDQALSQGPTCTEEMGEHGL